MENISHLENNRLHLVHVQFGEEDISKTRVKICFSVHSNHMKFDMLNLPLKWIIRSTADNNKSHYQVHNTVEIKEVQNVIGNVKTNERMGFQNRC